MPARPWLVDASDADATVAEPESDSPEVGEDLIAGWVVTNTDPLGESKLNDLAVWVIAKGRFRVIRQATDRSSKAAAVQPNDLV